MTGLVTLGEAMAVVASTEPGPLAPRTAARISFAGAEATVAIGVSRLGHPASWIGTVGSDAAGAMILGGLRAEGVDVGCARQEQGLPTGLMLRERRTADRTLAAYYRRGLAGSRLGPADVDEQLVAGARLLHVTGITPALSASARDAVRHAVRIARAAKVAVSLDVNYRSLLWSREEAAEELRPLVAEADVVFAGTDEASLFSTASTPEGLAGALAALGPSQAVIKLGAQGALAQVDGEVHVQDVVPVTAVDPIGAGDAFVAGYLAAQLSGAAPRERLRTAATCGAFAVAVHGDWEGLPRREELTLLAGDDVRR
ncbi:sugar kinase [Streptomyces sp. NA04227]|uniref:sugar kinase n=1 Tax=Streptomyces sp. NA04227 TaxID=2742136 RepID=UPI001591CD17|nr:sugar kinase [Streptomyces sp. NA04227]QKW09823.1 sugar kinase [Streptomyces sp. NA04227]